MLISALFVGLGFGFSAYHFFVSPAVVREAYRLGVDSAAKDLKDFMASLEPDFRTDLEHEMQNFSYNRRIARLIAGSRQSGKK